ncbi:MULTISPECIES: energy transducer TonB [Sinorhizobium/Ensifer group]|uniref:energy transducer TonB family protein n=1 Tax=Sinorhizobium/Ensifer group TaxID=227292 RepID=UPI0018F3DAD3|nr:MULTISPECIES: energy transducer TonB [Sinorhizobium/Ensifer group]
MKILLHLLCILSLSTIPVMTGTLSPAHATSSKASDHQAEKKRGKRNAPVVEVRFVLNRKGDLLSVAVHRSSGNRKVDAEAISAIKRAAPFPKAPPGSPAKREMRIKMTAHSDTAGRFGK